MYIPLKPLFSRHKGIGVQFTDEPTGNSNVLICKTDTGIKLYEINEYPDCKYIAGYHAWGGEIYKKDETD